MKLSFSTLGCPGWTLAQIAKNGALYGYDGVELRISGDKHIDPALNNDERKAVRALLDESGLSIACISGYTWFISDDDAFLKENSKVLLKNVSLAADLNTPYVRTFLGQESTLTPKGEAALRICCDEAAGLGVMVLIELHDSLNTGRQAAELLDTVNSKGLGVLWDIHHTVTAGESPEDTWRYLGKHIKHVHIKDADTQHALCLMGQGMLPAALITRLLIQNGYDGFFSLEWEKMWHPELAEPETAFPQYVSYMRSITPAL